MPECYTHTYVATEALMRSGNTVASHPAFKAGANGPDPLYMYHIWKRQRKPNLPALAARMHREKTGEFLQALIDLASTSVQQSYVLGYITHYTTDCTLHPYIAAMSIAKGPYPGEKGRYALATALDSELYYREYRTRLVPLHAGTPVLITEDLAQVAMLLREAIMQVYKKDIPLLVLSDAFHDNLAVRRLMITRTGAKKLLLRLMEPAGVAQYGGTLADRTQPGARLKPLPANWKNPFTKEEMSLTLDEVLATAVQTGAVCITGAMRYWLGELEGDKLKALLSSNDYYTGLPSKASAPETAPQQEQDAQPQEAAPQQKEGQPSDDVAKPNTA